VQSMRWVDRCEDRCAWCRLYNGPRMSLGLYDGSEEAFDEETKRGSTRKALYLLYDGSEEAVACTTARRMLCLYDGSEHRMAQRRLSLGSMRLCGAVDARIDAFFAVNSLG
jgi:hypothetical protein